MRKHLNLIQFSRALVPLFVILFHADAMMNFYFNFDFLRFSTVSKSGGVYYFFALSGFMIYYLYHKEIGNSKIIRKFLYSRFTRIYPVYWILTLVVLPIFFILPNFGEGYEREISTILTSFLLLPTKNEPIIGVAWSLVHTVFFYLMFSLFFLKNKNVSKVVFLIWVILTFVFNTNLLSSSNYLISFIFNFNNLIFISGIACAYVVTKIKINYFLSLIMAIIGFFGFPFSWFNTQYAWIDINLEITTSISSVLLILGLSSIDLQKDIMIPRFSKYLGNASFSIYLTHYLSMSFFSKILSSFSFITINYLIVSILLIVLAVISGCIVYTFIEKPINQKFKNIYSKKKSSYLSTEEFATKI